MLRTKKPQPASLSGYLRQRIATTLRWHEKLADLMDWQIPIAEYEDQWDEILLQDHGIKKEEDAATNHSLSMYWRFDIFTSRVWLDKKLRAETEKKMDRARVYQRIIAEESRLATKEKRARRNKRVWLRKVAAASVVQNVEVQSSRKPRKTKMPAKDRAAKIGLEQIDAMSTEKRRPGRPRKVQGSFGTA